MAKKEPVVYDKAIHGERLEYCIKQCSDHKAIIEAANDAIREIKKVAKDELGVDSKKFMPMLAIYHNDKRDDFEDTKEEILEMYDELFNKGQ